jgi:hypothetical protein
MRNEVQSFPRFTLDKASTMPLLAGSLSIIKMPLTDHVLVLFYTAHTEHAIWVYGVERRFLLVEPLGALMDERSNYVRG